MTVLLQKEATITITKGNPTLKAGIPLLSQGWREAPGWFQNRETEISKLDLRKNHYFEDLF